MLARASYSTSIGRPGIASIIPSLTVNEQAERLTVANTSLKPQRANNFDFTLEYYFEPIGLFSTSFFLKEVSDFIYTDSSRVVPAGASNGFDGLYSGYAITTTANGGDARYRGFEVNYQQQFTFLPGFLSGFGVNMNYTQLQTKGDYGGKVATTQVAGFRPRTGNIALNYRFSKYEVRVQTNWLDTYLTSVSTNAAFRIGRASISIGITFSGGRKSAVIGRSATGFPPRGWFIPGLRPASRGGTSAAPRKRCTLLMDNNCSIAVWSPGCAVFKTTTFDALDLCDIS